MTSNLFELRLFGGFFASVDQCPLPKLRSRKGVRLLALLVLRANRSVERSYLAGQLWPELLESQSIPLLRRELTDLKRALGSQRERITSPQRSSLQLDLMSRTWGETSVDVLEFLALASHREDPASLDGALALYTGPFLEGYYDDWVMVERDRFAQEFHSVLESRARIAIERQEFEVALPLLRRGVLIAPYNERWTRRLMETLARMGRGQEVASAYEQLCQRLRQELSSEPERKTRELYLRLCDAVDSRSASKQARLTGYSAIEAIDVARPQQIPFFLTRFFSRENEIRELHRELMFADPSARRLISLTGPGGAGKTRLAVEMLNRLRQQNFFVYDSQFLDVAEIRSSRLFLQALCHCFGVRGDDEGRLLIELGSTLNRRATEKGCPLVLFLDNMERLLAWEDAAATRRILATLLSDVASLRILVTSRCPLQVPGELEYPIGPLSLESQAYQGGESPSVELFLDRARSVRPNFALDSESVEPIREICRYLDGIPLAIELAASWARALSPTQMLDHFRPLELEARGGAFADRQKSVRASLEWSYRLLSSDLQEGLAMLSVFHGGFSLEAAEAVLGTRAIELLAGLMESSLMVNISDFSHLQTYRLFDVVREFAIEKSLGQPAFEAARMRHANYYCQVLQDAEKLRHGSQIEAWRILVRAKYPNLEAALQAFIENKDWERMFIICQSLPVYWILQNAYQDGCIVLEKALYLTENEPLTVAKANVALRLGILYGYLGQQHKTRSVTKDAIAFFESMEPCSERDTGLTLAGYVVELLCSESGDCEGALQAAERSISIARRMSIHLALASALVTKGSLLIVMEKWHEAISSLNEASVLFRNDNDTLRLSLVLCHLSRCYIGLGNFPSASLCLMEAQEGLVSSDFSVWQAYGRRCEAIYLRNLGEMEEAREKIRQAFELIEAQAPHDETASILEEWAYIESELGRWDRALFLMSVARQVREEVAQWLYAAPVEKVEAILKKCVESFGEHQATLWRSRAKKTDRSQLRSLLDSDAGEFFLSSTLLSPAE